MSRKYQVGRASKRRWRKLVAIILISLIIFGAIAGFVVWDMNSSSSSGEVEGASRSVEQQADVQAAATKAVNEPLFALQLAADWKETGRIQNQNEHSITWAPSKNKGAVGHSLKLYVDVIPKDFAINKLLPLDASGNMLTYRQISDNCKSFTTAAKNNNLPQRSKWQGVDFVCDLPSFVQNKVGTGTAGTVNATPVTGLTKGTHKYFFVYTDHNNQPDYQIFYNVLKSFQAK